MGKNALPDRAGDEASANALDELTVRQREVLQLLAEGYWGQEISSILEVSRRTGNYHKDHIMEVLGFQKSAELIQFAIHTGLFTPH